MPGRYRRPVEQPRLALTDDQLRRIGGLLDALGTLRVYRRPNGQEVVRLTVVNLREAWVEELRQGFGVGSRLGRANAAERGLTWSVEGRWACLHVAHAVMPYLDANAELWRDFVELTVTAPPPPPAHCSVPGCRAAIRSRALCGRHQRAAAALKLLGPATHGDRAHCPVCGDRHAAEPGAVRLCRRCTVALTDPSATGPDGSVES